MEGSLRDLALYRLETAKENLEVAKSLLSDDKMKFAMIMNAMEIRQKSDYDDFYIISRRDARTSFLYWVCGSLGDTFESCHLVFFTQNLTFF